MYQGRRGRVTIPLPGRFRWCTVTLMTRSDRITILLSVAALCVTLIGTTCSTNARIGDMNARIDDMNARIDDLRAEFAAQIAGLNARIDELRHEVREDVREIREDVREIRAIVIDALRGEAPAD